MTHDPKNQNDVKGTVGAAGGAAAGAAAGAAIGTVVPGVGNLVGAIVGGVIGATAGAAAGKAIADAIDPVAEDKYWRENHASRPYAANAKYDELAPAYRYGWESRGQHPAQARFEDVEQDLGRGWDKARGTSSLTWDRAKEASRDAWHRVERKLPGDADRDGR